MDSFEEKPHAVCCLNSVVEKIYPAQSETLGRSCERGDVCEDPVSLRQIVTSGAIILIVEGVLKVGHIACLILRILLTQNTAHCLRLQLLHQVQLFSSSVSKLPLREF